MKNCFKIFLFFLCFDLSAQYKDSLAYNNLRIGFSFSPDYSYRKLKAGGSDVWMKNIYDTLEVAKYGYTFGASACFSLNEKVFVELGLQYADKGEKTRNYEIPPDYNYINHYYFLDVPLKMGYYFINSRFKLFVSAGVSSNFYLRGKVISRSPGNRGASETLNVNTSGGLSKIGFSFLGGLGFDCRLAGRWNFRFEPCYRRSLVPAVNSQLKRYFYSAGANTGLFYRF